MPTSAGLVISDHRSIIREYRGRAHVHTQTSPRSRLRTGRPHSRPTSPTTSGLTPRPSALRSGYSATTGPADTTWTCHLQVPQLSQWFTHQAAALLQLGNHRICRPPSRSATCRPYSSQWRPALVVISHPVLYINKLQNPILCIL